MTARQTLPDSYSISSYWFLFIGSHIGSYWLVPIRRFLSCLDSIGFGDRLTSLDALASVFVARGLRRTAASDPRDDPKTRGSHLMPKRVLSKKGESLLGSINLLNKVIIEIQVIKKYQ